MRPALEPNLGKSAVSDVNLCTHFGSNLMVPRGNLGSWAGFHHIFLPLREFDSTRTTDLSESFRITATTGRTGTGLHVARSGRSMKTISRTVLIGLLIGAALPSMCQAGDPGSTSASASGTAVFTPASGPTEFAPPATAGLTPVPPSPSQSGRVQVGDSSNGSTPSTPGTPSDQAPGNVAYDSMGG